ncbi:hypothetical protein KPL47_05335 [Clostridium estertheticum]|uniref:hypothetical protein n=1 Tax=Clostridium estertheticum TaxID=238834 RepID=UPI001C0AAE67|nr:hypothetical protein [Clostridium estertheticum]MBU3175786.1 hypothetical protein [Clostridium estertheticum]
MVRPILASIPISTATTKSPFAKNDNEISFTLNYFSYYILLLEKDVVPTIKQFNKVTSLPIY